jgi:beta-lactamase regulating signal transducer with metallopeptidase domain
MTDNSPLAILSTGITFVIQIACGYLLTRFLCALSRSPQVRLFLWTCFLLLTVVGWVSLFIPAPVRLPVNGSLMATHASLAPHLSFPLTDSWILRVGKLESWALPTYFVVLVIFFLQLLMKRLRLELLLRRRHQAAPELLSLFAKLCEEMKVQNCQLSLHEQLRSPATVCWLRPRVLLPMELVPHLNKKQLAQILTHELIHVKRRDYLWDRLAALGCRILFFHPAVWLAYRHMRWERELACDKAVTGNNWDSRLPYAECLTTLAKWWFISDNGVAKGIGFWSSSSLMATRVRELLREPQRASLFERTFKTGLITAMLVVGVFLPGIALTLYRFDPQFLASRATPLTASPKLRPMTEQKPIRTHTQKPTVTEVPHPDSRPAAPDQVLSTLANSGSVQLPVLKDSPLLEGTNKAAGGEHRQQTRDPNYGRGPWDESSAPKPGSRSTNLRDAAIDAIRIGIEASGRHGSGDDGEQENH